MKYQPNRDYDSNDVVQTPPDLAERIVAHFKPTGRILEPCRGLGNFWKCMPGAEWCEISEGRDFFEWTKPVDWIVTNPPWSEIRAFLQHSMCLADHIVFLMTVNHVWTKARIRDIYSAGFGIKEICLCEMPESFPQSGFQLGAIYITKGWRGDISFADVSIKKKAKASRVTVKPRAKRTPEYAC
ncbi:hypothetical protein [Prosthecobacter sp.]|uniref:hypothetical protein n=1 Tax=Prosthecobacter sp. TaxID=1965333 RepID=UPI003785202B